MTIIYFFVHSQYSDSRLSNVNINFLSVTADHRHMYYEWKLPNIFDTVEIDPSFCVELQSGSSCRGRFSDCHFVAPTV